MGVADDTFWRNSECEWVKLHAEWVNVPSSIIQSKSAIRTDIISYTRRRNMDVHSQ